MNMYTSLPPPARPGSAYVPPSVMFRDHFERLRHGTVSIRTEYTELSVQQQTASSAGAVKATQYSNT